MAKHYIRIDNSNKIIKGFSSEFEEPLNMDVCIANDAGRQFELLGKINQPIIDTNGIPLYKYENNQVIERTAEEIEVDLKALPQQVTDEEKLKIRVEALEDVLMQLI